MTNTQSVSHWLAGLKTANNDDAQRLWTRYADRLVDLARRKLGNAPKRVADEEDIAQSVFNSLCRGAAAGRFAKLENRDDLWWILLAITHQKVVDYKRRETAAKRGGGRIQWDAMLATGLSSCDVTLEHLTSNEPTPEFLAMLDEQHSRLMASLRNDQLRAITGMRIEGYTVIEIAIKLSITPRTVERKLQLIRQRWSEELSHGR